MKIKAKHTRVCVSWTSSGTLRFCGSITASSGQVHATTKILKPNSELNWSSSWSSTSFNHHLCFLNAFVLFLFSFYFFEHGDRSELLNQRCFDFQNQWLQMCEKEEKKEARFCTSHSTNVVVSFHQNLQCADA